MNVDSIEKLSQKPLPREIMAVTSSHLAMNPIMEDYIIGVNVDT